MQEPAKVPKPILKKPPGQPARTPPPAQTKPVMPPVQRRVVLPSSFQPKKKQPKRINFCRFFCSFFLIVLLTLLLAVAVAGGLFYLWFEPKLPVFKLRPVEFSRFVVTAGTDGSSYLQTGANIWVEVKNPNQKLAVYYGGTQVELSADGDVELGSASHDGFTQGSGNFTVLRFVTRTGSGNQSVDAETAERLNSKVISGAVKLNVEVKTKVGIGFGKFKVGMLPADVVCGGVTLKKLKDGGPAKCQIKWFGWP